jgi:two-component system, cell cycle sensor histidine kinase and response regulator CckA
MQNEVDYFRQRASEFVKKCALLEKRLQQSEEKFFKIFYASSNLMAITSLKSGRFIDLNEASASLGGYKREDLIGALAFESNIWADPNHRDAIMQKLRDEGAVHNIEVDFLGRTGDVHKVLFSANPITVNDEPCMISVSVDITEREKKADASEESEEKYRLLVENSLQGLAIIQEARIIFCNKAFCEISGYSAEELLSFSDAITLIHPDDRELVKKRHDSRVKGVAIDQHYEYRIVRKDGRVRLLEVYASLVEYNGKSAAQIVHIDITERRQAEEDLKESREYLNQIINRISDPIFVKNRKHSFVLVNDALCEFAGHRREEFYRGSSFEGMPQDLAAALWEEEEEVFTTGKEIIAETTINDRHGAARTLMTKKSLLTDKNGNKQIVGVLREITEYKRLEAQFRQAQKMEAVGILAGGVAHDFNNLLNVINGYCELILDDLSLDNPMRKDLEQIREAGQRAANLTTQLLTFGRKQILQPKIINLNDVIAHASTMLRRLIGEDIELVSISQPNLELIHADPGQIHQIIMNLAVNARDAMPNGGKLTIETENIDFDEIYLKDHLAGKTGPYVMLAISDNGIGMDAAVQEHLFEPFYTTKKNGRGTGLGLSTVYGIVKQSNGFIWVYSEPGKGATFKIYFPRVKGGAANDAVDKKTGSGFQGSETVIIVEDEASVRALAGKILRGLGYRVIEAAEGMEALRISKKFDQEIQLILTDVVMPGMSGSTLVSQLKTERPGIKALYVSGYTDDAIIHHGVLESNVAFLQKPFTAEGLSRKVREVLDA